MDWPGRAERLRRLPGRLGGCREVGVVEISPFWTCCRDFEAQVDMNVVATGRGLLVEVGARRGSHSRASGEEMLDLAMSGVKELWHPARGAGELV